MKHRCHATGCAERVPPHIFMCHAHWGRLPIDYQRAVLANYRRGQEDDKRPTLTYVQAAVRAQGYIAVLEGRTTEEAVQERLASLSAAVLRRDGLIATTLEETP